jgi:hypothetical protein
MSVTFSGGITFTGGGFSFSAAPPSEPTAAWFGGSRPAGGVNQRIVFATDTATASNRGTNAVRGSGGVATLANGWWGGGYDNGSNVKRVTYATDTDASTTRGPLTVGRNTLAGVSDSSTYGWFGGGLSATVPFVYYTTVDRIIYATDTATATARGPLSLGRYGLGSTSTTSYGWFAGGSAPGSPALSRVDRIEYATDTATASVRGPLSISTSETSGSGNSTYGWFAGGNNPGGSPMSNVMRIEYATDTATGTTRGPLNAARRAAGQAGDSNYGWIAGGGPDTSVVLRITYATDTDVASVRGPLTAAGDTFVTANAGQY